MRRFLEEHRQPLGDYDRIRFDEAHIAGLREKLELATPLRVCWTWDYVKKIESLRALYDKGKGAQWDAETYLDWSIPVTDDPPLMPVEQSPIASILKMLGRPPEELAAVVREELDWGISQLLHGEQAALQLTAQLVNCVPDTDTKLFAGQQVVDECRHVEVMAKLLSRKFGTVHPIAPNIKFLLDEMLSTSDWPRKTIGMQLLFEGVALAVITDIGRRTSNPLVREVMRAVARDEARHAAFGVLALREELGRLPRAEHEQLEDWTWMCLEVVANGLLSSMLDEVAPRHGLDAQAVAQMVFTSPAFWDGRYHMFNHTVLPNLRKLGLVTERTRPHYDRFKLWEKQAPFGTVMPADEFVL
ncbi:MAG TPA: ferritin-like domain-containing protein [Kofleriaceae bacterium]|nr:ferritin-like domain-containing protein [Kofleriaceae bacterium]